MLRVRKYLPKTVSDTFSFLFLVISVLATYFFELFIVVQEIHQNDWPKFVHGTLGTFLLLNIVGNMYKVMTTNTSSREIILPSLLKPLWRYCYFCEANGPPRSFHCDKCRCCILKRDHHCVFTGCCIGLKNFRYYIIFLLHLAIGALYATILNMFFIWNVLGGVSVFSVLAHFVPFVFWVFGYLSHVLAFYALMSMLSITGFMFVLNLLILHCRHMLKNQTTYENHNNVYEYDLGWKQNIVESFGTNWHLTWLFPTVISPLPSDGLSFTFAKDYLLSVPKLK